ncbi:MAG: flagellar motor protein MotB [Sphingomonas sp. 28-66-16]|nr:MAG: flagellar motor protein MotB [Sphingomonas sp. 28-66-16]
MWLVTLADLALLLVGFFVLVQANQTLDRKALADGLRAGFGVTATAPSADVARDIRPDPMPVGAASVEGFAPGSSMLPRSPEALIGWARDATGDPRVILEIAGSVDRSTIDVDRASGSGAVLAIDRARAVAVALAAAGAVPGDRIAIRAAAGDAGRPGRRVMLTIGYVGDRAGDRP